jgi:hypothetical protein
MRDRMAKVGIGVNDARNGMAVNKVKRGLFGKSFHGWFRSNRSGYNDFVEDILGRARSREEFEAGLQEIREEIAKKWDEWQTFESSREAYLSCTPFGE